jgi:hypothetical protein
LAETTITRLIAEGMFDSEDFSDESNAIANAYLYRELSEDSALWQSDSAYIAFMLEKQGEPVGYLYDADKYMEAAYTYEATLIALHDTIDVQLTIFSDSIEKIDEWRERNPEMDADSMLHVWTDKINLLNQTANNINQQREAILNNNLQNAELQSEYAINGEVPEVNTAIINEVEVRYIESGQDIETLLADYNTIIPIAVQCPFTGGEAVIRARTFAMILNDSLNFEDDFICLQSGVYRIGKKETNDNVVEPTILVKPNPANDKIDIVLNGKFEGICQIQIINALNKIVVNEKMNCAEKVMSINVSSLAQGLYSVKISTQEKNQISKIAIIR